MKTKKPKRKQPDVGGDQNVEPRFPEKVLVPVTRECISKVLSLLDRFGKEQRCAAIVFNSCFYLDEMPFDKMVEKFEPIFGKISPEQVFVRVEMPRLAATPEEAYGMKFKSLNQAYIIADSGCTENDLNRRAAARQIFCCPMTIGCIRKNVKEGVYLMHRSVVLGTDNPMIEYRPAIEVNPNSKNDLEPALTVKKQISEKQQPVKSPPRKRDRIAATFSSPGPLSPEKSPNSPSTLVDCSRQDQARVKDEIDENLWKSIASWGNVVLKIRNLPLKNSVNAFNLMMGTTSIKSQQMIAKKRVVKRKTEVMDVMIVLKSDSSDLVTLMNKNGLKTALGLELTVERSHQLKLRKFMINLNDRINLDNSDKLPIKSVGYGNNCL